LISLALKTPHDDGRARVDTLTEVSRSRHGVGHPIWLASLALLIVNDHVLKGAGLLPGWLTGKLSDFAGLIVAPVLIATILCTRRAGARAAACAIVAAVFVAIKLSPSAARALERALALGHLHWRIWSDATDLLALAVLPVAWWLTGRRVRAAPPTGTARRAFERASVIGGALACLATSPSGVGPPVTHDLNLVNRTRATQPVAVYVTDSPLDCPAIDAGNLASLATATFTVGRCIPLEPGKTAKFGTIVTVESDESLPDTGMSPDAGASPDAGPLPAGCRAVVIRAAQLPDTVLSWPGVTVASRDRYASQIYIEEAGNNLYVAGTDYVDAAPAAFTLPASGCMGLP
jgi:hypothetical protein